MYDLNLTVPNLTSKKYSDDNRFLLLKNYLYELNETLMYALSERAQGEINTLAASLEQEGEKNKEQIHRLQAQSVERFNALKEKILRTAEDIERSYTSAITDSEEQLMQSVRSEFVASTDFGEYKSLIGSELKETDNKLSLTAQSVDTIKTDLESFKDETKGEFTVQAQAITSQVESLYLSKSDGEELEKRIGSQITQTAEGITENFSRSLQEIGEDVSSVGGELSEFVSDLDVYIRRGELEENIFGIEIGRSDSKIKARFTNDRLSFFQGIVEVAYISGSNLYITNAEFLDYFKIGNSVNGWFVFDATENGLEVRWIDGG